MASIILKPMTEPQFDSYISEETKRYARENVKAGYWSRENSIKLSHQAHDRLLSNGLYTKDHFFFIASDQDGRKIGYVWFAIIRHPRTKEAFIYDIFILKRYRGKGMGRMTLEEIAQEARKLFARRLSLHVFSHNPVAKSLYEKVGFSIDSLNMSKKL